MRREREEEVGGAQVVDVDHPQLSFVLRPRGALGLASDEQGESACGTTHVFMTLFRYSCTMFYYTLLFLWCSAPRVAMAQADMSLHR